MENAEVLDAPAAQPAAPTTAIAEYSPTAAALADLREKFQDVVWDVTTTKGNAEARAARKELVTLRTSLESKRKELKAPALERARLIDAEAKRIEAEILALETPIDAQIKLDEKRREEERAAKAAAERQRLETIQKRIAVFGSFPVRAAGGTVTEISDILDECLERDVNEAIYEEFLPAALEARTLAVAKLQEMLQAARDREAEVARLAAERAELERQQAELRAQQEALERHRREADAAAAEVRKAEEERIARERKAEEDRLAEERRKQQEQMRAEQEEHQRRLKAAREQEEREAAERKRVADEQAAQARLLFEQAEAASRELREAQERREAAEREEAARKEAAQMQERVAREAAQKAALEAIEKKAAEVQARLHAAASRMLSALFTVQSDPAFDGLDEMTCRDVVAAISEATGD